MSHGNDKDCDSYKTRCDLTKIVWMKINYHQQSQIPGIDPCHPNYPSNKAQRGL